MSESRLATGVGLVLVLVATGAMLAHDLDTPTRTTLNGWRLSPDERAELNALAEDRIARLPRQTTYSKLLEAYVTLQWETANLDETEYRQRLLKNQRRVVTAARDFVAQKGWDAYLAVGTVLAERMYEALVKTVTKVHEEGCLLQDWLRANKDGKHVQRLRTLSGRFLERAMTAGLIGNSRPPDGDRVLIARLLWLSHWVQLAGPGRHQVLTPFERRVLWQWKVEDAQHLSRSRRLELIRELEGLDRNYPGTYVAAIWSLRHGDYERAKELFHDCLEVPEEYRKASSWLVSLRMTRAIHQPQKTWHY